MITGYTISEVLRTKGLNTTKITRTSLVVKTSENRISTLENILEYLSFASPIHDRFAKGSSIGAIIVGRVKILVKTDGKSDGLDAELQAINHLNECLFSAIASSCGNPISIKLRDRIVDGVIGCVKTQGTPKSDFHLVDRNGKAVIHISHKKGTSPSDFQQWGGMTDSLIRRNQIVKDFIQEFQDIHGDSILPGESFARLIPDSKEGNQLKLMSVYGVDAPSGISGKNCVDVLIQGMPSLFYSGEGLYELATTGHIHYFPDLPEDGFDPVLSIIYKGDRDNFGIFGARAAIYPRDGRRFKDKNW